MPKETVVVNNPTEIDETCGEAVPGGGGSFTSDGILKPRSLFVNSFDVGQIQGLKRHFNTSGSWTTIATGGRDGGGYGLSVKNGNPTGGQYSALKLFANPNWGVVEDHPFAVGSFVAFNLFNKTLVSPMHCVGIMTQHVGFGIDYLPQVVISILPGLQIQAALVNGLSTTVLIPITTSSIVVPATGWFAFEVQTAVSINGNDRSGFVLVQYYDDTTDSKGIQAFKTVHIKTRSQANSDCYGAFLYGTEVIPEAGPGLDGIGVDDVYLYGHYGTKKQLIYKIFVSAGIANADGESIHSVVSFDSRHAEPLGSVHDTVGALGTYGVSPRVNNLAGSFARPNIDDSVAVVQADLVQSFVVGTISPFTGVWLTGPFQFGPDLIVRNTIYDEALDTYFVRLLKTPTGDIIGASPFTAVATRQVLAEATVAGGGVDLFNWTGQHLPFFEDGSNCCFRVGLRLNGINDLGRFFQASETATGGWEPVASYTTQPYSIHETAPDGLVFTPTTLQATQVLIKGDFNDYDILHPGGPNRWIQFDFIQAGFEFIHRKDHLTIIEPDPIPPIAGLVVGTTDLATTHVLHVRDVSVAWDAAIVSRVVDWGDASPTDNLVASPRFHIGEGAVYTNIVDHTYAVGNYTLTLTVTDARGLTDVLTQAVVVPNVNPVAAFSFAVDPGDPTDKTIDFTDLSTDVDGTVVAWNWDFGDGSAHSNVQNPTHVYAAYNTYTVTLTVTDNNGGTANISQNVDVVLVIPDCALSAAFAANTAFVQGDDYHGGNPPLPAYVNTAAYQNYYTGVTYRAAYDSAIEGVSDGTNYIMDGAFTFNGHQTLKMAYGKPAATLYEGAGWNTAFTDDAPVETFYTVAPFGPLAQWFWLRLRADAGVMNDAGAVTEFTGLGLIEVHGSNLSVAIMNRQNRIKIDIQHCLALHGAFSTDTFDVAAENVIFGSGVVNDVLLLVEGDNPATTLHVRAWIGTACAMAGVSPILNQTLTARSHSVANDNKGLAMNQDVTWLDPVFNPTGALKYINVAGWMTVPLATEANPAGVALV